MRYLLLLVLIAVLSNCTIHKRVHRKGWYVEWHKSYKVDRNSTAEKSQELIASNEEESAPMSNEVVAEEEHLSEVSPAISETASPQEQNHVESHEKEVQLDAPVDNQFESVDSKEVQPNPAEREHSITKKRKKNRSRGSGNAARTLFTYGTLFLILGLIAFVIGFFAVELGTALLAVAAMVLFGGLGIVLLLAGLIVYLLE